jgi:hypothetical protein
VTVWSPLCASRSRVESCVASSPPELELLWKRRAAGIMRGCALRTKRAAKAVVRNEAIVGSRLFNWRSGDGFDSELLFSRTEPAAGGLVVVPEVEITAPTLRDLIGWPGTTAQQCAAEPAFSRCDLNSSNLEQHRETLTPIESTSPLRSTPYRVLWKFAIARATPIDIMSFVTRRALSTLIPPKVGGFAACKLALSLC